MLLPTLTGWYAQFERLRRSYARVTSSYKSSVQYEDDLHHFMQDCWHLKEWIKNDPSLSLNKEKNIENVVREYRSLRIAADLANGSKHFVRNKHEVGAYVTSIGVTVPLGQDKPIDVQCFITLNDDTKIEIQEIVKEAYRDWKKILSDLDLNHECEPSET